MSQPFKTSLVNHRDVAKAFGVSTATLKRAIRKGEFPIPHSLLGSFILFDRGLIEYRLEKGLWPAGTQFYGARNRG